MTDSLRISPLKTRTVSQSGIAIAANDIATLTLSASDAVYHIIKGFSISGTTNVVIMQCYFASDTSIQVRCRNLSNAANTFAVTVYYC